MICLVGEQSSMEGIKPLVNKLSDHFLNRVEGPDFVGVHAKQLHPVVSKHTMCVRFGEY